MNISVEEGLNQAGNVFPVVSPKIEQYKQKATRRTMRRRGSVGLGCVLLVGAAIGLTAAVANSGGSTIIGESPSANNSDMASDLSPANEEQSTKLLPATAEDLEKLAAPVELPEGDVSDGLGGSLTVAEGKIVHVRADGERVDLAPDLLPQGPPDADIMQHWVHDVATLDGSPHLFATVFVNEGENPDQESQLDLTKLSDRKLYDEATRFTTYIVVIDLANDEAHVVEEHKIRGTTNNGWVYNDYVTSIDGENINVARSFWQGECYYTETLTTDGEVLDVPETFPKPEWIKNLDFATAERYDNGSATLPDCVTLSEWDDEIGQGPGAIGGSHPFEIEDLGTRQRLENFEREKAESAEHQRQLFEERQEDQDQE